MSSNLQNVEHRGFEPLTSSMPWKRATNCANAPKCLNSIYKPGGDSKLMACLTSIGRARGVGGGVGWRTGGGGGSRGMDQKGVLAGEGGRRERGGALRAWTRRGAGGAGSTAAGRGCRARREQKGGRKPSWRAAAGGLRLPSMTARHRGCARDCTAQSYALVTGTFPADP